MASYYVYIIQSLKDYRFYTGQTDDLIRRLKEHNLEKVNTPSTLRRGPFVLVHADQHVSREMARLREKFWKSGYGRELRDKMVKNLGE